MRNLVTASVAARTLALAAPLALVIVAGLAPARAAAVTPTGVTDTIHIELIKGRLGFVAPSTVTQGDELEIVNDTNPKQVGPHTFSLVTKGSLPRTEPSRRACFTPRHVCLSIARWHGFNPKTEQITVNPAKAGPAGWSTVGSTSKRGDSWFTGEKPESSFAQQVSASPGTLYFVCAIHPWMQGKVQVVAPQLGVPGV